MSEVDGQGQLVIDHSALECLFGFAARGAGVGEDVDDGDGLNGVDVDSNAEGVGAFGWG